MPPRYAYWTIIAGGMPTAFRAAARDELLPTFHRLREKHPDAEMKWFARGRLWDSPEAARAALDAERTQGAREPRGRDWRPGGAHRDPRQKYKDAKRAKNAERRRRRFERRRAREAAPASGGAFRTSGAADGGRRNNLAAASPGPSSAQRPRTRDSSTPAGTRPPASRHMPARKRPGRKAYDSRQARPPAPAPAAKQKQSGPHETNRPQRPFQPVGAKRRHRQGAGEPTPPSEPIREPQPGEEPR